MCVDEGAGRAVAEVKNGELGARLESCNEVANNGEGIRGGKLGEETAGAAVSIGGAIERCWDGKCCALVLKAAAGVAAS